MLVYKPINNSIYVLVVILAFKSTWLYRGHHLVVRSSWISKQISGFCSHRAKCDMNQSPVVERQLAEINRKLHGCKLPMAAETNWYDEFLSTHLHNSWLPRAAIAPITAPARLNRAGVNSPRQQGINGSFSLKMSISSDAPSNSLEPALCYLLIDIRTCFDDVGTNVLLVFSLLIILYLVVGYILNTVSCPSSWNPSFLRLFGAAACRL